MLFLLLPPKLYLVFFYQVSLVNQTKVICLDFRRPSEVLVVLYHMFIPHRGVVIKCSSMIIHWHIYSNNLNMPKCQDDHPNFGGMEWKTHKLSVVYSTTYNNQGKKHPRMIRLTNKVYETESFTDTIMLEHFITTPLWGMNMWYSTKSTS